MRTLVDGQPIIDKIDNFFGETDALVMETSELAGELPSLEGGYCGANVADVE